MKHDRGRNPYFVKSNNCLQAGNGNGGGYDATAGMLGNRGNSRPERESAITVRKIALSKARILLTTRSEPLSMGAGCGLFDNSVAFCEILAAHGGTAEDRYFRLSINLIDRCLCQRLSFR